MRSIYMIILKESLWCSENKLLNVMLKDRFVSILLSNIMMKKMVNSYVSAELFQEQLNKTNKLGYLGKVLTHRNKRIWLLQELNKFHWFKKEEDIKLRSIRFLLEIGCSYQG
jgi:hypothetical protein